jgi:hypothetical protein
LFEIYEATFLVLANQFADILAGRAQSPVATCPSTYSLRASGREMFSEVIGIPS